MLARLFDAFLFDLGGTFRSHLAVVLCSLLCVQHVLSSFQKMTWKNDETNDSLEEISL